MFRFSTCFLLIRLKTFPRLSRFCGDPVLNEKPVLVSRYTTLLVLIMYVNLIVSSFQVMKQMCMKHL